MKNLDNPIGIQTRNHVTCNTVPQPNAPPLGKYIYHQLLSNFKKENTDHRVLKAYFFHFLEEKEADEEGKK
jgi:hypothetical protein